jgi:hypothetical protein
MTASFFSDQNFLTPDLVTSVTASSEQTNFYANNLYSSFQRTRVWRSAGYFNITSSNNVIIFRETAATDLTATISVDEYVSTTELAAAVKTALEDTGASTYTVIIDDLTGKWKITSNGLGGGGIFELMWTDVLSTAATVLGFSTSSDDTGGLTYTGDVLSIHTSERLVWDLGVPSNPTSLFIFGDRNRAIQLSPSASIKIEANTTNNFSSPAFTETLAYDERVIYSFNDTGIGDGNYRYWSLEIVDEDNSNGYVELGSVFLGSNLTPARGRIQFGFNTQDQDFADISRSLGGQIYGVSRSKNEVFQVNWRGCTNSDKELLKNHFKDKGTTVPFVAVIDPNEAATTEIENLMKMVKYASEPDYVIVSPNFWEISMVLEEAL